MQGRQEALTSSLTVLVVLVVRSLVPSLHDGTIKYAPRATRAREKMDAVRSDGLGEVLPL